MPSITFTVIIPTICRPTLAVALASLQQTAQSWQHGDEILLIGDGARPDAERLFRQYRLPGRYVETARPLGGYGHPVQQYVLDHRLPRTTHLLWLDDDNAFAVDALGTVRRAIARAPRRPHIFRMQFVDGIVLWRKPELREGNVSPQCACLPNDPNKLGTWGTRYEGDFDFLKSMMNHYPDGPVWRPEVICAVNPTARYTAPEPTDAGARKNPPHRS